ncbi:hypothetical protein MST75_002433 [Salmonella enterica]|uniref:Uncharacterized protein n=1 Tax=Salmonella diarizonae TaxID=59204 RepID=A0A379TU71_SALDZ|nr:hypothetical protein [Salmonella enterica]EGL0765667.1 hypothetical protein [Salmonella enterica subsp. enterica]EHM9006502.1 hypothetical protein [Salmonella enterica]EID7415941.1 hypothetical protein [Salmonella enterica]EIL4711313.1 hypothetical protein [Salmonella enterica]EIW4273677.1 hypothetical protein [Salmonella enterica]
MKIQASVAMSCDPVFAKVCTGKRINRPDNRRFFQVVKRRALSTTAWSMRETTPVSMAQIRKNCFCIKKVICEHILPRFACLLPSFPLQMQAEDRER